MRMENREPFITIGIASYNYANYLPEAFEAIRNQQFRDFEILYCDDGSTDESVEVIKGFIRDNPDLQIRLVEAENQGIIANKNRILDHARGKFLMICDADDYMAPNCLELLCGAAMEQDADCVIGAFQEVDQNHRIIKNHLLPEHPCKWIYAQHHARIYRLDLVRDNGIRILDIPDDMQYLQTIHCYSKKCAFVHTPVYFWRQHQDSVSKNFEVHKAWSPVSTWKKLTAQIESVRNLLKKQEDLSGLEYYFLKQHYIVSLSIRANRFADVKEQAHAIHGETVRVLPELHRFKFLRSRIGTADTAYAKTAVVGCWLLDKIGLFPLVVYLKNQRT